MQSTIVVVLILAAACCTMCCFTAALGGNYYYQRKHDTPTDNTTLSFATTTVPAKKTKPHKYRLVPCPTLGSPDRVCRKDSATGELMPWWHQRWNTRPHYVDDESAWEYHPDSY